MSLVTFLGIYFVRKAGIDLATVGVAFLCEHLLRGLAAPLFGAWSDRIGRRALLIASAALTAIVLPSFLAPSITRDTVHGICTSLTRVMVERSAT